MNKRSCKFSQVDWWLCIKEKSKVDTSLIEWMPHKPRPTLMKMGGYLINFNRNEQRYSWGKKIQDIDHFMLGGKFSISFCITTLEQNIGIQFLSHKKVKFSCRNFTSYLPHIFCVWSITNSTCIHLRVRGSYIYMYRRGTIYKEPPGEIQ
jgi:hypothetical protein